MKPPRARLAAFSIAFSIALSMALSAARPARAAVLDPARAEEHARAIAADDGRPFCERPPKKLEETSKRVCPLAAQVPGCERLVAVCEAREKDLDAPKLPSIGERLASFLRSLGTVAAWVLVIAIVLAILVPVLMAFRARRRDLARAPEAKAKTATSTPLEPEPTPDDESDAESILRAAEASAAAGAFDRALFGFLRAALVALDRRGAIRLARDRTHGEYVRACREQAAKPELRAIVAEVDRVRFGGEPATEGRAREAGARATAIVRAAIAATTVLLALLTPGCDALPGRGNDPAGPERFVALLKKQGATVSSPSSALATLPLPGDGGATAFDPDAVLVLDLERFALPDEARLRVERWVRAGGTLVIAGPPPRWPSALDAELTSVKDENARDARFVTDVGPEAPASPPEDDDEAISSPASPPAKEEGRVDVAHLARADAFRWGLEGRPIALFAGGRTYAALGRLGAGRVLAFANDDLFTNLGLSREGNPAALIAALAELGHTRFLIAGPEHAQTPPEDPLAALIRAGLGLALVHAAALLAIVFVGRGARLGKPTPTRPPARRAFVEHVRAIGALYDRADHSAHALAAYGRFALERLRGRLPRGEHDVAAFVATRAGVPREAAAAMIRAAQGEPPPGREAELSMLKDLGDATALALAKIQHAGTPHRARAATHAQNAPPSKRR